VRSYLAEKLRQLRPGGRLLIRDVVGPESGKAKSGCGLPLPMDKT